MLKNKKKAGTWPGLWGLVDLGKEFGFYCRCNWKFQGDLLRGYATNQAEDMMTWTMAIIRR